MLSSSPFSAIWLRARSSISAEITQLHLMTHGRQLLGKVAKTAPRIEDAQRPVAKARQAGFDVAPDDGGANAPLGGVVNVAGELVGATVKTLILLQEKLNFGHPKKRGILSHPEFAENSRKCLPCL